MSKTALSLSVGLAAMLAATPAFAQTEISWWHSMGGELGERLEAIAADFNASQSDYVVVPSYRGEYEESMVNTIAAFRARLRDEVDLDTLTVELLAVVEQTMQPTQAWLWLRPPQAPSTSAGATVAQQPS